MGTDHPATLKRVSDWPASGPHYTTAHYSTAGGTFSFIPSRETGRTFARYSTRIAGSTFYTRETRTGWTFHLNRPRFALVTLPKSSFPTLQSAADHLARTLSPEYIETVVEDYYSYDPNFRRVGLSTRSAD